MRNIDRKEVTEESEGREREKKKGNNDEEEEEKRRKNEKRKEKGDCNKAKDNMRINTLAECTVKRMYKNEDIIMLTFAVTQISNQICFYFATSSYVNRER